MRPIGIACALPEELAAIEALLQSPRQRAVGPLATVAGFLDGTPVIVALTGVGKVEATVATTVLCQAARARGLLALGVAGSLVPDLRPGDIVVGLRVMQHDFGVVTDQGLRPYRAGQLPLPGVAPETEPSIAPALEEAVRSALAGLRPAGLATFGRATGPVSRPRIRFGTIATGDAFVAGEAVRRAIRARTGALAVEMEGAAVARVGARFGIPVLVVRAISDQAGSTSATDFAALLVAASASAAAVARRLVPVLAAEAGGRQSAAPLGTRRPRLGYGSTMEVDRDRATLEAALADRGEYQLFPCDPALADTAAFCAAYGFDPADSANTIIVAGKSNPPRFAACVVLATHRLDVNRAVRDRLGTRKASFATTDQTRELTGQEIGGVTAFGLPDDLPVLVDAAVMSRRRIVLGGGSRSWKVIAPPSILLTLAGVQVVPGLATPAPPARDEGEPG